MMELSTVREDATGGEEGIIDYLIICIKCTMYTYIYKGCTCIYTVHTTYMKGEGRRPGEIDQNVDCECIHTRTYTRYTKDVHVLTYDIRLLIIIVIFTYSTYNRHRIGNVCFNHLYNTCSLGISTRYRPTINASMQ